jgi:hypothetical protein
VRWQLCISLADAFQTMNMRRLLVLSFCLMHSIWIGCGSSDNVAVFPVKGTVNFNGKPMLGGGSISLIPTGKQEGATAGGEIKADGTYELSTYKPGDGSMPGDFRVVINQVVFQEPEPSPDGSAPGPAPPPAVAEPDRIPTIYSDSMNSPLTMRVEATANEINLDLKPQ